MLIPWWKIDELVFKKQNCVSLSTVEVEYIVAASYYSQVLWIKTKLMDYGYKMLHIPIYYHSKSVIAILHNPINKSKIKHIEFCYHFFKDHIPKGRIENIFVPTHAE